MRTHTRAVTEHAAGIQAPALGSLRLTGGNGLDAQVDQAGNVLVTALTQQPPPGGVAAKGVVVRSHGDALNPELRTIEQFSGQSLPARPATALSDGRLAFLTGTGAGIPTAGQSVPAAPQTKIEVLDLATDTPVATIDVAPDNDILGIALAGDELTWVQQPVAEELGPPTTTDPSLPTCEYGDIATGPPILEQKSLAELGSAQITVGTSPVPVACTELPPPP